jgi:hypothetical protein
VAGRPPIHGRRASPWSARRPLPLEVLPSRARGLPRELPAQRAQPLHTRPQRLLRRHLALPLVLLRLLLVVVGVVRRRRRPHPRRAPQFGRTKGVVPMPNIAGVKGRHGRGRSRRKIERRKKITGVFWPFHVPIHVGTSGLGAT